MAAIEVTIFTHDPSTGQLTDTPDLVTVLRYAGSDHALSPTHVATGKYRVTFDDPGVPAELYATSTAKADGAVVWTTGSVEGGEAGNGDLPVNHDTGGTDNLRVVAGSIGVDDVTIRAFLTSDYDAGTRTVRGTTYTGTDGRWVRPMMLDEGDYTFTFAKDGFQLQTATARVE